MEQKSFIKTKRVEKCNCPTEKSLTGSLSIKRHWFQSYMIFIQFNILTILYFAIACDMIQFIFSAQHNMTMKIKVGEFTEPFA